MMPFVLTFSSGYPFCAQADSQEKTYCPKSDPMGPQVLPPSKSLDLWFRKFVNSEGISIVASGIVCDRSLQLASLIINHMLSVRPDVRNKLIKTQHLVAIFGIGQKTTDVPGNTDLVGTPTEETCGGGGIGSRPTSICESNLISYQDKWKGMSVAVHEFGHTIMNLGLDELEKKKIEKAFQEAKNKHLFPKSDGVTPSFMMTNEMEYFAEGTGIWFAAADTNNPANSPKVKNREQLKDYDPDLYRVLSLIYPNDSWVVPQP